MSKIGVKKVATRQITLYLLTVIISTFIGCNKKNAVLEDLELKPLKFSAIKDIDQITKETRIANNNWEKGDLIGIYAVANNKELNNENIIDNNNNIKFETSGNGIFASKDKNILYPIDGSAMDIIAYYPYNESVSNFKYPIDINNQTEVLYSNNLKGISIANNNNNNLHFKHALTKLILNISPLEENTSLDGLTATANGVATKGNLNLTDGTLEINESSKDNFSLSITGNETNKQIVAYLLPTNSDDELKIKFESKNNKTYTWTVPDQMLAGKVYRYSLKLDKLGIEITKGGYMELPIYATGNEAPNSILAMHMVTNSTWLNSSYTSNGTDATRNYSILFDTKNRIPYWVAYPMHPVYLGSAKRTDDWDFDPKIAKNLQPDLSKSWTARDLDRGHMLASSDRNASTAINRTTFYYTNMVPQNNTMNGGKWNVLEGEVRDWAKDVATYDTLFVVTGAVLPQPPKEIEYTTDANGIQSAVPEYMYKALLKKHKQTGEYTSIVFKMTNNSAAVRTAMSVAELEKETGFVFFNSLPPAQAASVKQNKNTSPHWN